MTQSELAERLGCDQGFVSRIERAHCPMVPRDRDFMIRIYRLTRGAVTPNDFYDLPDLEQLALPIDNEQAPAPVPLLESAAEREPSLQVAA